MKLLTSLDTEALGLLGAQDSVTLLLGDWRAGLVVDLGCPGAAAVERIGRLRTVYGSRFVWRAFNQAIDVWWDGDFGGLGTAADRGTACVLLPEPDWRRHAGMARLRAALGDPPDLRRFAFAAEEVVDPDGGRYYRLTGLVPRETAPGGPS